MDDKARRELGEATIKKVYAGDVVVPPEGYLFSDVMLSQVFADQWNRDATSMRDKRILLLGMIAAQGEAMTFKIQTKAALKNGELSADQVRELHLFIAQYCGYPRAASMLGPMEEAIAEAAQDGTGET
ncbi:MAG: 4-carboxymuconolactone decarboxylase [Halioglobus sp.]|nr:4-carboxymuconolactone decarboxylase [Halioglobus sp.]|tara:strand:+ start:1502 stop:1885 length:384 start_codon:yes stop_codon:yes gene_type:complete